MPKERYFKNNEFPYNGFGKCAKVVQFHLAELDEFRQWLQENGAHIDSEKSIEDCRKHAQWLLDTGRYDWHIAEPNDLTATLYENLPKEDQYKIGYSGCNCRWSKWTVDEILAKDGWEPNEVYWFSLHKDDTYCYQLILKEGSYVCREYYGDDHKFYTLSVIDGDVKLPDWSSWVEIPNLKVVA